MGEVWAAVHRRGEAVALKLLTDEAARDPKYRTAFRNEIRNAAQLDHPNVVAVYDYGEIGPEDEARSGGRLALGTPWLAMERLDGGTLLPHCGGFDWWRLTDVVLGMLDALAHAHARGVTHRDLKPANILLGRRERLGQALVVKLTDFGLAHATEDTEEDHFNGGTPAYMAPEQFDGRWRNYGPWTDLYGFGCCLFALVTGAPPFGPSAGYEASRRQHHEATVPALDAPFPVPAGFESWLRRLLEKDPARRYRRAADALVDFLQLGPPADGGRVRLAARAPADQDTVQLHTLSTMMDLEPFATEEVEFTVGSAMARPPPLPSDWRELDERRAHRAVQAGLALFGVRTVPLVGREGERDALWAALHRVRDHDRVEVVALHGPAGLGKSRLAEWVSQRAHEVGSAILLRATHGPVPGPRDGLAGMAHRFLRCEGLGRAQIRDRVAALVGEGHTDEEQALLELLAPGVGSVRFGSTEERHHAVWQLIVRATAERPVVLWLDDVHWGPDALRFVRRLLEDAPARPVLVVMTATDEALAERKDEQAVWEELLDHARVRALPIGPIPPDRRADLVREMIELDPELARRVGELTAGDPLFVVQLLGDWVERDLLLPGERGFRLPAGADALPADLSALWEQRVERLLIGRPSTDRIALELAATLGMQVNRREWVSGCRELGVRASDDLVDALLHARLARTGDGGFGWAFTDRRLHDAVLRRAHERGTLTLCHRAAASLIAERLRSLPSAAPGLRERLGRHLVGAGAYEAALEPLLAGIGERVNAGDHAIAEELLALREAALDESGVPDADPRWGEGLLAHFHIARRLGDVAGARGWLDRIEDASLNHGWMDLAVGCRVHRARLNRQQGELDKATRALTGAIEDALAIGDPKLVADARCELAEVAAVQGRLERAEGWVRAALADYEQLRDRVGQARCWQLLGELVKERGEHRAARVLLRRAAQRFEEVGNRWGWASALNSEGDAARHDGLLDEAEALYRRAGGLFRAIGSSSAIYPHYNYALTLIARGRVDAARPLVVDAMRHFRALRASIGLANAHLALAACSAAAGRWADWDEHLREGIARTAQIQAADEDIAWIAEVAGQHAAAAGETERARQAWEFALETWAALDRRSRLIAVREALDQLG